MKLSILISISSSTWRKSLRTMAAGELSHHLGSTRHLHHLDDVSTTPFLTSDKPCARHGRRRGVGIDVRRNASALVQHPTPIVMGGVAAPPVAAGLGVRLLDRPAADVPHSSLAARGPRPPRPCWCPVLLPSGWRPSWGRSTGWSWCAVARTGNGSGTPSWSAGDLPRGARARAPPPSRTALAPPPHVAPHHTATQCRVAALVKERWGGDLNAPTSPCERTRATADLTLEKRRKLAFPMSQALVSILASEGRARSRANAANKGSCSPRAQPGSRATSANAPQASLILSFCNGLCFAARYERSLWA
jgi:hypothetical protein